METVGKYLTSTWAAVISAILLLTLYVYNPSPIETLQLKTFDYFITSLEHKKSDEVVLVEFGEKSVEKYGQWPFDRRDIAGVIQQLRANGAGVIVAPILFSEKDRAGGDAELIKILKKADEAYHEKGNPIFEDDEYETVITKLEKEYGVLIVSGNTNNNVKDVELKEVDIEEESELAQQFGIRSVPTMVLMEDDKEIGRKVGVLMADKIEEFIHQ